MIQHHAIQITSIEKLAAATEAASWPHGMGWWRGQGKSQGWPVLPQAYRRPHFVKYETSLTAQFIRQARSRRAICPDTEDYAQWLFLMQHYGLPTRLLDWSESALVAAFFATEDDRLVDEPGVIYALNPTGLNETHSIPHILTPHAPTRPNSHLNKIFEPAFNQSAPPSHLNLACSPSEIDPRMMVQSSQFTAHGLTTPLEDMAGADKFLMHFEVPAEAKKSLRAQLNRLGVRRSILFPDLDNLATAIVQEFEARAHEKPEGAAGSAKS
jgi:hypothetical protein